RGVNQKIDWCWLLWSTRWSEANELNGRSLSRAIEIGLGGLGPGWWNQQKPPNEQSCCTHGSLRFLSSPQFVLTYKVNIVVCQEKENRLQNPDIPLVAPTVFSGKIK